jgi:cell division protein FtsB
MKKLIYLFVLIFTLTTTVSASTALANKPKTELTAEQRAELAYITQRVEAIKAMDKSLLSKAERKALKKEVRELKKRSDFLSQNVTLSLGAIIIILLLLILIL